MTAQSSADNMVQPPCKVCGSANIDFVGVKVGEWIRKEFTLFHCGDCGFAFIGNPCTNYEEIYDARYYRGEGADPKVDYLFELNHPNRTIRRYEWEGIAKAIRSIRRSLGLDFSKETNWLDFGCGSGSMVRWLREQDISKAVGFEEGAISRLALERGTPILNREDLLKCEASFDIVTAIEVMEHVEHPLETLRLIRFCMKPNAIFFFTTGNAEKFGKDLINWSYIKPEIHISFYEPRTMEYALSVTGFEPVKLNSKGGFSEIITFKILKNLGVRSLSLWQRMVPWPLIAPLADRRYGVTAFPVGRAI